MSSYVVCFIVMFQMTACHPVSLCPLYALFPFSLGCICQCDIYLTLSFFMMDCIHIAELSGLSAAIQDLNWPIATGNMSGSFG